MTMTHKHGERPCRIVFEYATTNLVAIELDATPEEIAKYASLFGSRSRKVIWSIVPRSELTPL